MKVGILIACATCGHMKKPVGRSGPLGAHFCESSDILGEHGGCPGYWDEPRPGSLWPGETEADFGYPIGPDGVKDVD